MRHRGEASTATSLLSLLSLNGGERGCACNEREKARRNDPFPPPASILGSPAAEEGPKRRTHGKPPSSRKAKWRKEVYKKEEAKGLYNRRTEAENSSLFGGREFPGKKGRAEKRRTEEEEGEVIEALSSS